MKAKVNFFFFFGDSLVGLDFKLPKSNENHNGLGFALMATL
jgi:hypothetical protein